MKLQDVVGLFIRKMLLRVRTRAEAARLVPDWRVR